MRFSAQKYDCRRAKKKRRGEHDEWKKIKRTTYTQSWIFFCSPFAFSASRFIDLLFLHFLSLLSPVQLFGECHRVLFALLYCSFVCSLFFVCFCFIHFVVFSFTLCKWIGTIEVNKWASEANGKWEILCYGYGLFRLENMRTCFNCSRSLNFHFNGISMIQ